MTQEKVAQQEIESFFTEWSRSQKLMPEYFQKIYEALLAMPDVSLNFSGRPGVSYSLRPRLNNKNGRQFFAIVDIIDDDPDERWLSVCFYADMISDPEELGQQIPGGLAGDDGYCFDLNIDGDVTVSYLLQRLQEAHAAAERF